MNENLREIAPGFYRISIPLLMVNFVHTYAFVEGERVVLFDTGPNMPSSTAQYADALAGIGKEIEDVDRIFITHAHVDHFGFAGRIKDLSGARIHISEIDDRMIREFAERQSLMQEFGRRHGLDEKAVRSVGVMLKLFASATAPFLPDCFLSDLDTLSVAGIKIVVYSVPGHTRGQVCFYLPEEEILLSGDHILPHITPNLSPDLLYPFFSPLESYLESLDRIGQLKVKMVYPAHGEPFADLKGRVGEIKRHHEERKRLIHEALDGGSAPLKKISQRIFSGKLDEFDRALALNETYVHLQQMEREGTVEQIERDGAVLFRRL